MYKAAAAAQPRCMAAAAVCKQAADLGGGATAPDAGEGRGCPPWKPQLRTNCLYSLFKGSLTGRGGGGLQRRRHTAAFARQALGRLLAQAAAPAHNSRKGQIIFTQSAEQLTSALFVWLELKSATTVTRRLVQLGQLHGF